MPDINQHSEEDPSPAEPRSAMELWAELTTVEYVDQSVLPAVVPVLTNGIRRTTRKAMAPKQAAPMLRIPRPEQFRGGLVNNGYGLMPAARAPKKRATADEEEQRNRKERRKQKKLKRKQRSRGKK